MGTMPLKNSKKPEITNEEELEFYTEVQDPNFGLVKIYKCRKYRLCYILKYDRVEEDTKIYNTFQKIELSTLSPLLSLYGFNIERKTCCNKTSDESLCSYWEYYNFYFNDYLQRRRKQNLLLVDSQIWHVVEVCCETFNLLRKFGIYYQIVPNTFVITPEGKLKASWCHLRSQNKHIKYLKFMGSKGKICRFPYSPEQLESMHNKKIIDIDFEKCNSYRLGMLLLQCLSLVDPLSNCYNPSMTAISSIAIKNIIVHKVVPSYPNEIVSLLKVLLRSDPASRPSMNQIYQDYNHKFNQEYELRVCGMKNPDQSFNHPADFFQTNHMNQPVIPFDSNRLLELDPQILPINKGGLDLSDDKTVKFQHSRQKR